VTPARFAAVAEAGAFCVHWQAHGLQYGIPADVLADTQRGTDCLANLSRSALPDAQTVFPDLVVLNITASPDTLARRLQGRGRETQAEIAARLARAEKPLPEGMRVVTISNDGALSDSVAQAIDALHRKPERYPCR
jgi:ribose 1,5-bisphosphokinase